MIPTIKVNFTPVKRPEGFSDDSLSTKEKHRLERENAFRATGIAYAFEHGSRTSTIGHVLSASPISLLAWYVTLQVAMVMPHITNFILINCRIGEKFLDWVDEPLSSQAILESVSLYWFTETFPRGIYFYREVRPLPPVYG